jgi:hypothetical protein
MQRKYAFFVLAIIALSAMMTVAGGIPTYVANADSEANAK